MSNTNRIGHMLRLYRDVQRVGIREAARDVGISPATLSRVERGDMFDVATAAKLFHWLMGAETWRITPTRPAPKRRRS